RRLGETVRSEDWLPGDGAKIRRRAGAKQRAGAGEKHRGHAAHRQQQLARCGAYGCVYDAGHRGCGIRRAFDAVRAKVFATDRKRRTLRRATSWRALKEVRMDTAPNWHQRLHDWWRKAVRMGRLSIGVADYDTYVQHLCSHHPERPVPTYAEFFT